jgi:hypothetical protein
MGMLNATTACLSVQLFQLSCNDTLEADCGYLRSIELKQI